MVKGAQVLKVRRNYSTEDFGSTREECKGQKYFGVWTKT